MNSPDDTTLRELVLLACQAPSLHNTQPWHWVQTDHGLRLHAATERQLRHVDPEGRDLVVSCGAALHQLVVAAAGKGWAAEIDRLPDPEDGTLLAAISFTPREPDIRDTALLRAIANRRTDRRQVSSWAVPQGRLAELTDLASQHGVLASLQPSGSDTWVRALIHQAADVHGNDEACQAELLPWIRPFPSYEGMPMSNLLTETAAAKSDGTRFPPGSLTDNHSEAAAPSPSWLVLSTASDDTLSWLRVGEALEAIWLTCTVAGLSVVPFSEPIEVESTREILQHDALHGSSCPQLLLRIGWPPVLNATVPPIPRRPLDDVFEVRGLRRSH